MDERIQHAQEVIGKFLGRDTEVLGRHGFHELTRIESVKIRAIRVKGFHAICFW